jgi:hypothetical protein
MFGEIMFRGQRASERDHPSAAGAAAPGRLALPGTESAQ